MNMMRQRLLSPTFYDWRQLPFPEIWIVDTEFYPGAGLANGGVVGDPITPLCLVAKERRSGRVIRLWQDELGKIPPYPTDGRALIVGYALAAEFGFHVALGWPEPAHALDAYVEFRHLTNDGSIGAGGREKGFYSIGGALRYFGQDEIDTARKDEMRKRILQGPPFTDREKRDILLYCEDDVIALDRLFPHTIRTLRPPLGHAMFRAKVQWTVALHERRGVPMNGLQLGKMKHHWQDMRCGLVEELDGPFGCFEIVKGRPHWRRKRFAAYLHRQGLLAGWLRRADGNLDESDEAFLAMVQSPQYRHMEPLRNLRYALAKLRISNLSVGADHRNRAPLWAYGTKTGRHAPKASQFIFGPAKWLRFMITPPPWSCLVHRDFMQQEVRIAAVLSGDGALLYACESGDVYEGIATQLGFIRESMNLDERAEVRSLFKIVVLSVQYGTGFRALAQLTGISEDVAAEILARLKARFPRYAEFCDNVWDHAALDLEIGTPFGWYMQTPPGMNPRTIRNYPMQSTGSEIQHVMCVLAERRNIQVLVTVHDAVMAEGPADCGEDLAIELDRLMGDASAVVLQGYRLPTDKQIIKPGETYFDKRGKEMWATVSRLLAKIERGET